MEPDSDLLEAPQFVVDRLAKTRGMWIVVVSQNGDITWEHFGNISYAETAYIGALMTKEAVADEP